MKKVEMMDEISISSSSGKETIQLDINADDTLLKLIAKTNEKMEIGLETNFVVSMSDCGLQKKDGSKLFSMSRRIWTSLEVDIKNKDKAIEELDTWQNKKLKEWSNGISKNIAEKKKEKMNKGYIDE